MSAVLKFVFGISEAETSFARRGFRGGEGGVREVLERVGKAFVSGYNGALEDDREAKLKNRLDQIDLDYRGFAYEGAAMALGILDRVTPWKRDRVQSFLRGAGEPHTYMVHVALGWVGARMPWGFGKRMRALDPVLRWLVIDGYGFHEGFFHWPKYINGGLAPKRFNGYAKRVFDQGFGRSLWFIEGGEVPRIAATLRSFAPARHNDLWSGIGLASVYAGAVGEDALWALRTAAREHSAALGQGAAFAAKARHRAGNVTAYTERSCRVLCDRSAEEAARLTDEALENLPVNGSEPSYEIWRQRIQQSIRSWKEIAK